MAMYFAPPLYVTVTLIAALLFVSVDRRFSAQWVLIFWGVFGLSYFAGQLIAGIFFIPYVGGGVAALLIGALSFLGVILICSVPLIISGMAVHYASRRFGLVSSLAMFPALLVVLEMVRDSSAMAGGSLAYVAYDSPIANAILPMGGEFFLVLFVACAASLMLALYVLERMWLAFAVLAFLVLASHFGGAPDTANNPGKMRVALIQPGIDSAEKYHNQLAVRKHLLRMISAARASGAALIVAPESIVIASNEDESKEFRKAVSEVAHGVPLVYGELLLGVGGTSRNRAFYIDENGEREYNKRGLVLFGEYIPGWMKWILEFGGIPLRGVSEGFDSESGRISTESGLDLIFTVCYEQSIGRMVRESINGDSESLIISLSDYSWVSQQNISRFTYAAASIRAQEVGVPVIQAGVDRATFVMGSRGAVITQADHGAPGILYASVTPERSDTLYRLAGNQIAVVFSILLAIGAFAMGFRRK